jgi:predicted ATP-grasp superfamily ATP-dependent carboligase
VVPTTEVTTLLLTQQRESLPENCRLPFPDANTVANASNKAWVVQLAAELGVPVPRTIVADSAAHALAIDLPFPVVVKPARSRVRTDAGWLSTGVSYAENLDDLRQKLQALPTAVYPGLLQERIEGPGRGLFACFDHGRAVALFAHRRLREKPPSGGVSVLCESAPLDPVAVDYGTRLLSRLEWQGVAMVEFKQDRRDGSLRLMEINARFWGSLQLAIDAGVDFPRILADVAAGNGPAEPGPYTVGVRTRWLAGDLDALLLLLTRSRQRLDLPASHPGRVATLASFLRPWGGNLNFEIERRDDLGPARLEWRRRLMGG